MLSGMLYGQAAVPDVILYRALFQRVTSQKTFADHIAAQGKNDSAARIALRDQAGLSAQEYATLESTARDCLAAHSTYLAQRSQMFTAIQAAAAPATASQKAQLAKLAADDDAMSQAHIAQLHTGLGDARFQALDAFARSAILPHIVYKPIKRGGS